MQETSTYLVSKPTDFEGGPGFGNREPQDLPLTRWILNRGYQLLYLDYRGTGLSTPINTDALLQRGGPEAQADYLKLFRADSIVRDFEAVRKCLTAEFPEDRKKWSSFGQSYGGFVTLTYLSLYPQGLRECFMTGGLAPVRRPAEDVYRATFKKVIERNQAYYKKYPEDVERVHRLAKYIGKGIPLPGGGQLTVPRLLSMGLSFGAHGGLDSVHSIILKATADLDQFDFLTRASLLSIESQNPFDTNPIYAILHESIYCYKPGIASNWAAYSVGKELEHFSWLAMDQESAPNGSTTSTAPLYFSGEMIFPFHFTTYPELAKIKEAAYTLAAYDEWDVLYDEDQLRRNEVPLYAASYVDDMYVDADLARETAQIVRGTQVFETNSMYHNALRARSEEVLAQLFKLRDDTID